MRKQRPSLNLGLGAAFLLMSSLALASARAAAQSATSGDLAPTAVSGESWLTHLGRSFDETSMGKTGRLGPPEVVRLEDSGRPQVQFASESENATVVLRGADLYRMNCRGCHGESGAGVPPEINSVINPVRATSAAVMIERVKATGADMSRADALKLAQQSRTMLLDRLHHGGQDMPAFPHLSDAEVRSLIAYLRQLAGVRGAESEQLAVRVRRVRVGEHIAKSTCHICHSAAGPNPVFQQLYDGAIPPLSTLLQRTSRAEFIRKVTQGAPIVMGSPPQLLRGRMPVFYYLSEEEAADVYLYLLRYPPYPFAILDTALAGPVPGPDSETRSEPHAGIQAGIEGPIGKPELTEADDPVPRALSFGAAETGSVRFVPTPDTQIATFAVLLGLLATLVMSLGFWFTACELRRLSRSGEGAALRREKNNKRAAGRLNPEIAA